MDLQLWASTAYISSSSSNSSQLQGARFLKNESEIGNYTIL